MEATGLRAEQFPQVPDRHVDRALELFLRLQLVHELAQIRIREFVLEGPRHLGSCRRRHELEAGRAGLQEALGLSERVHGVLATFGHFRIRLDLHPTKVVHPMSPGPEGDADFTKSHHRGQRAGSETSAKTLSGRAGTSKVRSIFVMTKVHRRGDGRPRPYSHTTK